MNWLAALPLLIALISTASANTFKLECLDAYDSKTRLALIEVNTDAGCRSGAGAAGAVQVAVNWRMSGDSAVG